MNILRSRKLRFLAAGGFCAAVNLGLIILLVDGSGFQSPLLKNLANVISIELSLLLSFIVYRTFVWSGGGWQLSDIIFRQLPLYHVSAGWAVCLRVLLLFPALDVLGVHYVVNTIVGVLVSAAVNYRLSDRLAYNDDERQHRVTPPEGLEPAFHMPSTRERNTHTESDAQKNAGSLGVFSIVIPAYNEEGSIQSTVLEIASKLNSESIPHEILVVNDNSHDQTEQALIELKHDCPTLEYVNNYYPNGFGFAVRCGLEQFSGDAVAIVMADASDSPDDIVQYYRKLQEGYDCVFGSRFVHGGQVIDYPVVKLLLNRLANSFIQVVMGTGLNDTTNAFKAYHRRVIHGVAPLISHHFNLTVELPLKAIVRGYSFCQVPISWQNRKSGVSKLKINEMGSRYLFIVLSIFLEKYLSKGDYRANTETSAAKSHEPHQQFIEVPSPK